MFLISSEISTKKQIKTAAPTYKPTGSSSGSRYIHVALSGSSGKASARVRGKRLVVSFGSSMLLLLQVMVELWSVCHKVSLGVFPS